MAYCRWSSDDFRCDVYTYEDVGGGWTTHVASRKRVFASELPPPLGGPTDAAPIEAWVEAFVHRQAVLGPLLDGADLVPIGLPHDGRTFTDPTPGDCADRLDHLRELGYRVPQDAIVALRDEQAARVGGPDLDT